MTRKNQDSGIRNIIIICLAILLGLVWMIAADRVSAVANYGTTDSQQMYLKNGKFIAIPPAVQTPHIAFTDLISGPDTGLGDGLGSGAIVTVWGQRLGNTQGTSTIQFCDSLNVCRTPHIYYWKAADGQLPSGPANLYESHGMQEIAISIPDSAQGAGQIRVTTSEGVANTPFTVRSGNIYHVKSTGNDSNNGSFNSPWATVAKATETGASTTAGDTIYIHDSLATVNPTRTGANGAIYFNNASALSGLSNQFGVVAYPNSQPIAEGLSGFANYNTAGQVVSKFIVLASNCDEDANGQPVNCLPPANITMGIQTSAWGRAIGNKITDRTGMCADGYQGAISGNKNRIEGFVAYGNHVYEYGCPGTNYQGHTLYFSIRENITGPTLAPIYISYNYLHDNEAKNGLHYFDEDIAGGSVTCGQFSGTMKMNNNVVINQAGAGIFLGVRCNFNTAVEYKNNILINTGLKSSWDGISGNGTFTDNNAVSLSPGELQTSNIVFENNTIIGWNNDNDPNGVQACLAFSSGSDNITIDWNGNICSQSADKKFIGSNYQGSQLENNITGGGNSWYTSAGTQTNAVVPSWDSTPITADPLLTITGSQVSVGVGSPIIDQSSTTNSYDIYGNARGTASNVGAVEGP